MFMCRETQGFTYQELAALSQAASKAGSAQEVGQWRGGSVAGMVLVPGLGPFHALTAAPPTLTCHHYIASPTLQGRAVGMAEFQAALKLQRR